MNKKTGRYNGIQDYAYLNIGPVMYRYTSWILQNAAGHGLRRLYFLARDGYALYRIAEKICAAKDIDIECRYLYCSRISLRIPSFCKIGEEAFDMLLCGGYHCTPRSIINRILPTPEELDSILSLLDISDPDAELDDSAFRSFCEKLRSCDMFRTLIYKKSEERYLPAIDYLRQEGLFQNENIAIVDSGWTGSMQRSLRQLLESAGYSGKIFGYYFGMYAQPKSEKDGEYLTFYFNHHQGLMRKVMFNNNLFECMLSADHAMTVQYNHSENGAVPVLGEECSSEMQDSIRRQLEGILKYTDDVLNGTIVLSEASPIKQCYRILKRCMVYPTREEAELYSVFKFNDDTSARAVRSLAELQRGAHLKEYVLPYRIMMKLLHKKPQKLHNYYWVYAEISYKPFFLRWWYRLNVISWEILKYILKK